MQSVFYIRILHRHFRLRLSVRRYRQICYKRTSCTVYFSFSLSSTIGRCNTSVFGIMTESVGIIILYSIITAGHCAVCKSITFGSTFWQYDLRFSIVSFRIYHHSGFVSAFFAYPVFRACGGTPGVLSNNILAEYVRAFGIYRIVGENCTIEHYCENQNSYKIFFTINLLYLYYTNKIQQVNTIQINSVKLTKYMSIFQMKCQKQPDGYRYPSGCYI